MPTKQQLTDMLQKFQEIRAKLRTEYEAGVWSGPTKEAVKYYMDFYADIDNATPDTIVQIISDNMRRSEGDEKYMAGLRAIATGTI